MRLAFNKPPNPELIAQLDRLLERVVEPVEPVEAVKTDGIASAENVVDSISNVGSEEVQQEPDTKVEAKSDYSKRVGLISELVGIYKNDPRIQQGLDRANGNFQRAPSPLQDVIHYLEQIGQYPVLSRGQLDSKYRVIDRGLRIYAEHGHNEQTDQAITEMMIARQVVYSRNLRLAAKFAIDYYKNNETHSMSLTDVVQEANIGLWDAVDRFDISRGNSFATVAIPWIKSHVDIQVGMQSRTMRLPFFMHERTRNVQAISESLHVEFNRPPTKEEIAERMNIKPRDVEQLEITMHEQPTSLNITVRRKSSVSESVELGDLIEDERADLDLETTELNDQLLLSKLCEDGVLNQKQLFVLSLRYNIVFEKLKGTTAIFNGQQINYDDVVGSIEDQNEPTHREKVGAILGGLSESTVKYTDDRALALYAANYL